MDLALGALDLSGGKIYVLDGSNVPYLTSDDVKHLLPGYAQGDDAGRMRDIVLRVMQRLFNKVWADTGIELNALRSPRFAEGVMLDVWGILKQMPRAANEEDPPYRLRLLAARAGITPNAIRAAVIAVAATDGATVAFQEPLVDGPYWTPDSVDPLVWDSFWQSDDAIYWNYNNDPTWMNQTTGGFWSPDRGACFFIIMQSDAGSDALVPHWTDDEDPGDDPQDFFAPDGAYDYGFFGADEQPLDVRIVSTVEALKAFGVSWMLIESPALLSAV